MRAATYVTASWCAPCKTLLPKVKTLCEQAGIELVVLDMEHPSVQQLGLMSVPALKLGDELVTNAAAILPRLKKYIRDEE